MDYKHHNWEHYHYRFGLAGEGQADVIERYLRRQGGRVLDMGCGPRGRRVTSLAEHCNLLIAADKSAEALNMARIQAATATSVCFVATDAFSLCVADEAMDHIVALGLFAYVPLSETTRLLSEFHRVCRTGGHPMLTNSVGHDIGHYRQSAQGVGFHLLEEHEGYCPAASGDVKRRYLVVFIKKS